MGNLINDYWTYEYKDKKYFGVVEIIKGEDLAQSRADKKYETHIEKALDYTMKHDVLSHMSIQTYCTWLKDKPSREDNEQKYYPFILEFEPKGKKVAQKEQYQDVLLEVAVYVKYLISEFAINKDDITVMINNSKSIYVFVNPKSFDIRPDKDLNKVYTKMYEYIKSDIGLKYVDESIISSGYKLMKTPNTLYKGGYFVWITIDELMQLLVGGTTREELTRNKRSLNKIIPGLASIKAVSFYNKAKKAVKYGISKIDKCSNGGNSSVKCEGSCVKYMQEHFMEKGYRNYGLVSIAIYLKSMGYTKEEVEERLIDLSQRWNHDENIRAIKSKVNSVFRKNYKFSCTYARNVFADMDIENMCSKCPYNKNKGVKKAIEGFEIDSNIINSLWANKASTRHYLLYLKLVKENLFNKQFIPSDAGIDDRTLREFCKYALLARQKDGAEVNVTYIPSKRVYTLPEEFFNDTATKLGEAIKPYLKLFVKGFRANSKYMLIRSSMETIMNELDYKDEGSVYRLFRKLKDIGLLEYFNRTSSITLYYTSFKIIDINELKEEVNSTQDELKVVGQLNMFDFNYKEIVQGKDQLYIKKGSYRGSPSPPKNSG